MTRHTGRITALTKDRVTIGDTEVAIPPVLFDYLADCERKGLEVVVLEREGKAFYVGAEAASDLEGRPL